MYVTYADLIQLLIFIVALVGLIIVISDAALLQSEKQDEGKSVKKKHLI